jgi:pectin-derived oligosaccharide transport system permease protein
MFAMATLALTPVLVFFLIFQRRITDGISTTGLKG